MIEERKKDRFPEDFEGDADLVIEGTLASSEVISPAPPFFQKLQGCLRSLLVLTTLVFVLVALLFGGYNLFGPKVEISLTLHRASVLTILPLRGVRAHPGPGEILVQRAVSQHSSERKTKPTTGVIHVEAKQAKGLITFENVTPSSVEIEEATEFRTSTGVLLRLLARVRVPASLYPNVGRISAWAIAVHPGEAGNLQASVLHETCPCEQVAASITIANLAFTGGEEAQERRVVAQSDIDSLVATAEKEAEANARTHLQGQIWEDVRAVGEIACSSVEVDTDKGVGEQGFEVAVSVTSRCQVMVTDRDAFLTAVLGALRANGMAPQESSEYQEDIQAEEIGKVTEQSDGSLDIEVRVRGSWKARLSSETLSTLVEAVKGKCFEEARLSLLAYQREHQKLFEQIRLSRFIIPPLFDWQITVHLIN